MTPHRFLRAHRSLCILLGVVGFFAVPHTPANAAPPTAAKGTLIANGDFEAHANSEQWPDGWPRPKSGGSWETESGNHFLRLTSGKPGETVLVYLPVTVPHGIEALELSWRQRVSNLKPGKQAWFDARIMMEFKDAAGEKMKGSPPAPNARKSTDGWVARSTKFLVPEGAHTLEFMPALFQVETGTFDLDDIVLQPTDASPLREAAKVQAEKDAEKQAKAAATQRAKAGAVLSASGSLISNGNFEEDKNPRAGPMAGAG